MVMKIRKGLMGHYVLVVFFVLASVVFLVSPQAHARHAGLHIGIDIPSLGIVMASQVFVTTVPALVYLEPSVIVPYTNVCAYRHYHFHRPVSSHYWHHWRHEYY
jgi:hypothetical protein